MYEAYLSPLPAHHTFNWESGLRKADGSTWATEIHYTFLFARLRYLLLKRRARILNGTLTG